MWRYRSTLWEGWTHLIHEGCKTKADVGIHGVYISDIIYRPICDRFGVTPIGLTVGGGVVFRLATTNDNQQDQGEHGQDDGAERHGCRDNGNRSGCRLTIVSHLRWPGANMSLTLPRRIAAAPYDHAQICRVAQRRHSVILHLDQQRRLHVTNLHRRTSIQRICTGRTQGRARRSPLPPMAAR